MNIEPISVLGSTGSIGTQALDVIDKLGYKVFSLTANRNIRLLEEQIRKYRPEIAAVTDEKSAWKLKQNVSDIPVRILSGMDGICECAAHPSAGMVLNAIVGIAGLRPTMAAVSAGKDLALANKETLVAGGKLVMEAVRKNGVKLLPVDSEHSAIFQCLQGCRDSGKELKKIILTASGGPFYGYSRDQLQNVSPEQALRHPNWSMGAKITIDSATLMNKGLELIEASWLFNVPPDKIEIVVQRESVIHSAVEFTDNSVIAQMGTPDMRIPIQYAMTWPRRLPSPAAEIDWSKLRQLTFGQPDTSTFKCLKVCMEAAEKGGLYPCAANGANEQAVSLFLQKKIGFLDIGDLVEKAVKDQKPCDSVTIEQILMADQQARLCVEEAANQR